MIFTKNLLLISIFYVATCQETLNGRYTKSITNNFKLVVPHRKTPNGDFDSFHLQNFFEFDENKQTRRRKRSLDGSEKHHQDSIHYGVDLNDNSYHIELWPNHDFLSPNLVFEDFDRDTKVGDKKLRTLKDKKLCHYVGRLRGDNNSRAAISTCDGLTGHIILNGKIYYIEPVEQHTANSEGHHLHVLFDEENVQDPKPSGSTCGVTNEKWVEGWRSSFKNQMKHGGVKQKRGSVSVYRYIETLAVCDKKFLMHHRSRDVENYLLTLMNMLFDLYHDATVGAQIDVVTLRIIYLEKEDKEINLKINTDASASLESFCQWQTHLNTENGDPNHHDVAMLFTRHDLCDVENNNNCGLVGLAYVSEVCTQEKHCAINEDTGIMVAITATHELGHLLGCNHDEQGDTPCAGIDPEDGSSYIMHPMGTFFSYKWSTCSKGFISSLFESNLGECLNNEPKPTLYPYKQALPGVVYNANEQCHLLMPETHENCDMDNIEFCDQLWCKKGGQCVGDGNGPADGTKCGENKWCFRKKCVETGERPKSIDGGWGEWGEFSACSRTCGGGISTAERFCDHPVPENRGLYCLGERKKTKVCSTEPCPQGSPPFRQVQCEAWNNKEYNGARHQWEVFGGKIDKEPCALYCINEQHSFSRLSDAQDGTPCKMGTKYMCIQGDCKKVGCDWGINSDAVEDICGVCNGDGTQCRIIDEVNNEILGNGYEKIAIIPAGARNILIEELKPSMNIIAIADKTEKHFYLNGNNMEHNDGPYKFGKVEGVYSHTQPKQEKLVIHGPLLEDLVFMVAFYKHENVGYRYKYAEMTPDSSYTPSYHWELTDYGPCSTKCGGGTKTAEYNCIESKAGKVSANFCTGIDKPNGGTQVCNELPCKTEWRTGKWGPCRACKKRGGVRTRDVECIKENPKPGGDVILEEDDQCPGPKPGTQELCQTKEVCGDKRKRSLPGVPDKYLGEIWSQMNRKSLNPDKRRYDHRIPDAHLVNSPKETSNEIELKRKKRTQEDEFNDGLVNQNPIKESDSDRLKRNHEKKGLKDNNKPVNIDQDQDKMSDIYVDASSYSGKDNIHDSKQKREIRSDRHKNEKKRRNNLIKLKSAEVGIKNINKENYDFVKFGPFSDEAFQVLDDFANIDGKSGLHNARTKRDEEKEAGKTNQSEGLSVLPDNTVHILNNFAAVEDLNKKRKKRSKGSDHALSSEDSEKVLPARDTQAKYTNNDNEFQYSEHKATEKRQSRRHKQILDNDDDKEVPDVDDLKNKIFKDNSVKHGPTFIKLRPISDEAYQVLDEDFFNGNNDLDSDNDRMKRGEEKEETVSEDNTEFMRFRTPASEEIQLGSEYNFEETSETMADEELKSVGRERRKDNHETTPCRKMSFLFDSADGEDSTSNGNKCLLETTTIQSQEEAFESVIEEIFPNRKCDAGNGTHPAGAGQKMSIENKEKGKIVLDKIPAGQKTLMIVDLKSPHPKNRNISDKVFQTMGDDVKKDVGDRAHQRNLTGESAVKVLAKLAKDVTTESPTTITASTTKETTD